MMARHAFNKANVQKLLHKAIRRVHRLQQKTAGDAMDYLVRFGYHAKNESGPDGAGGGAGWSFYYAANWNYGLGSPNTSVITPYRPDNAEAAAYASELAEAESRKVPESDGEAMFVTNSVHYGRWLNDGGENEGTFVGMSQPNRFLELCEEHIRRTVRENLKVVKDEVK